MSVFSYPDRGKWGKNSWRGNCSGHVYKELFERIKPGLFVDPMVGSGTSVEVAREMGIEAYGLDLHSGFNAIRDSIAEAVGKPADLVVSHPPYGAMIVYSGNVWGQAHPDDLSRCADDEDFHRKMQLVLLNQREATTGGGYYGTIIGDWRRGGVYTSYQAEMIARMPKSELAAVMIKMQHNVQSGSKSYGNMRLPFILHEYILLWQKKSVPMLSMLQSLAQQQYVKAGGNVVPGASANADTNYTLAVEIGRNLTPNWALGLTLGLPPTAKLYGTGTAAPLGELGRVQYGPAVLSLQYQFDGLGAWQPYLGLGINRTIILDAPDGTLKSLNVESAWGSVIQAGTEYNFSKKMFAFVDLKKIFLKTNATGTLGGAPTQARVTLNPLITTIGLGWRF